MQFIETVEEMQRARKAMKGRVGLVPTMGFLHEGHLTLVRQARADNDHVIVSIFVNPTQFGPNEDFDRYPRNIERDRELLEAEDVDVIFAPPATEIYPSDFDEYVELSGPLVERLEGESRPGFFRGVCTVVARIFRIIRPHRAYFGQKDAQQFRVIRSLVQKLKLGVDVIAMPTIREPDGLAMSSRNAYLSPGERGHALILSRVLGEARRLVAGGVTDAAHVRACLEDMISREAGLDLDYVSVSDEKTLTELDSIKKPALALVAARVGRTRLIDNTLLVPPGVKVPAALKPLIET